MELQNTLTMTGQASGCATKTSETTPYVSNRCLKPPPMSFFPNELIFAILIWLPVKSLMRFKCVCRSWKTLISDPLFVKDHLRRTSIVGLNMTRHQFVSSIINEDECKFVSSSLQSLLNPHSRGKPFTATMCHKFRIIGSCDGLLCLYDILQRYVILWNPSTRSSSNMFPIGNGVCINSFVTNHGFGYDHVNDKYKVLVVVKNFDDLVTKIFTFGPNSWTTIQNFPYYPFRWLGKFVSGTLNWIAKGCDSQLVIISLDLGNETFGELLLPEGKVGEIRDPVLDVSRDSLCFCFFALKRNHWVVWLMKEYRVQDSWTKLMIIPRIDYDLKICRWNCSLDSLCILENGVVLLKTAFLDFVLYNSNDGSLDYPGTWSKYALDLHTYHESLVSAMY